MINNITKRGVVGIILLFSIIFISACGSESESSNSGKSAEASETNETNERVIEHAMGETTIEGTPEKVVTLYQGATDATTLLDIEPVGIVESWVEKPIYTYLRDDLEGTKIVGEETQPNLEEIAALNPDVIFASKMRHEEIYEKLNQIAPTVAIEDVFDYKGTVALMGETLNKQEEADAIIADWNERLEDFKEKAAEKLGDDWPKNVSLINFRSDHARIYFDSFAGTVLREAGFERPANQQEDIWGVKLTDKESITEMNADVFYVFMSDEPAVKESYEDWTSHPLWENLDAVKNDEVYMVDEVIWNMAGGMRAANLMLDDLYERFDLEK